jgi:hypothetical protein
MTPVATRFHAVFEFLDAVLTGAMRTTIEDALTLHAVPDHAAATVSAGGRQGMDGALKAVKHVRLTAHTDFKTFVVHIPAHFTSHLAIISHGIYSFPSLTSLLLFVPSGRLVLS